MTNTADNVRVGVTGEILQAPKDTALPTNLDADPNNFDGLGYISEDGVQQTIGRSTEPLKAWGGDTVRTIQTEHDVQYTFTFIETNPKVLATYYNDPEANAALVKITAKQAERKTYVIDVLDGDNVIRLAIPDAQVTDTGDVTYATAEAIGYQVTIDCYPDADGVKVYKRLGTRA